MGIVRRSGSDGACLALLALASLLAIGARREAPPSPPPAAPPAAALTAAQVQLLEAKLAAPPGKASVPADPVEEGLRRLGAARAAVTEGDGAAALAALEHPSVAALPLPSHVSRLRAEALLLSRRDEEAVTALEALVASRPAPRLLLSAHERLLHASRAVGREAEEARRIHEDRDVLPDAEETPAVLLGAARLLSPTDPALALDLYRRVAVAFPTSVESSDAEDELAELAAREKVLPMSGPERLARARAFLAAGRYQSLKREITDLRKITAYTPAAEDSEMLAKAWGKALLQTGSPADALAALRSYEKAADVHPDAVYDLAQALGKSGDGTRRAALLQSILTSGSPGEPAERRVVRENVAFELAASADGGDDTKGAAGHYLRGAELLTDSPRRDELLFRGGFLAWRTGERDRAIAAFTQEIDAFPDSTVTPMALWWRARLRAESGDAPGETADLRAAASRFPTTYYGRLAADKVTALSTAPAPAGLSEARSFREGVLALGGRGTAALLLRAARLSEEAYAEAEALRDEHPESVAALTLHALALRGLGKNQKARESIRRALPGVASVPKESATPEIWDLAYPVEHRDLLAKAARDEGLPVTLLMGLVFQESSFEKDATSRSGAMGLMQLMPGTASDLARELKIPGFTPERAYEPELNVAMGSRYLGGLVRRLDGSVVRALAGYNGGPARTERYWTRLPEKDPQVFIESIPIKETRLYVKKVLEAQAEYARVHF